MQPSFVRPLKEGIELRIKVVAGARRSAIVGQWGDRLKLRVAAPAERGKANEAVVNLLRSWLGVNDITIVAGHWHSEKAVRIVGLRAISEQHLAGLKTQDP
jgi:uncharacterized protein (TIGR00251 family)